MDVINLNQVIPFITKDGSEIRELLAHRNSAIRAQSLAEARVPPGGSTQEHYHRRAEEIYYITSGMGRILLGGEERDVREGDAIAIPPGVRHKLWNTGESVLTLLCCCAPAYEHEDTVLTERPPDSANERETLSGEVNMEPERTRLFIKPYCGWCMQAMEWLDGNGIRYETLDVISDGGAYNEMRELSGQTMAPVIEVDGEILADFGAEELEAWWRKQGFTKGES